MILSFSFVLLAAFFNAIMDVVYFHPSQSRLKGWWAAMNYKSAVEGSDPKYIDGDPKKGRAQMTFLGMTFTKPVQLVDGWHFSKMMMIFMIAFSNVAAWSSDLMFYVLSQPVLNAAVHAAALLVIYGLVWNLPFNVFYNNILRTKKL